MTKYLYCLVSVLIVISSGATAANTFESVQVAPVETDSPYQGLQPSGLTSCNGKLLMVSDRHNHTVFELQLGKDSAIAKPFLTLDNFPKPNLNNYDFGSKWWANLSRRYDWEGISCKGDDLYLLSETLSQVLVVPSNGKSHWLGDHSYLAGQEKGLFEQFNAKAEGVAIADNQLFIAAERQPRGIVKSDLNQPDQTQAYYLNGFPDLLQPEDFSGLFATDKFIYTLERNHFQVCQRDFENLAVNKCWSYEAIEKHPQWRYQDQRFGKAEGITLHQGLLYIVLDNNEDARQAESNDARPLLMVFKIPDGW